MSESWHDYKILDHPAILNLIFYPRADDYEPVDTERSTGFMVPVEGGIHISCRFFFGKKDNVNMLFFHGNGELAGEYEDIGLAFNNIGINLFVADYRGYGGSSGRPTVSNMIKDAHPVASWFNRFLEDKGYTGNRFIMGRSLGSASAIDLAAGHSAWYRGVVIESGFCDISDLLGRLGPAMNPPGQLATVSPGFSRVMKITMPALIIHGEYDSIVPLTEGEKIYRNIGSEEKRLVIVPDADHNTIFAEGADLYLRELAGFIDKYR
ncbi:MAG: alpha/beta hydrolase [Chloroflexi bacterium]|nr:alpha/beta hydrolase [Chloroflexota bacterium]